jgi:hypothetical protein
MLEEISLFMFLLASISGGIAGVLIVKIVERILRSIKKHYRYGKLPKTNVM